MAIKLLHTIIFENVINIDLYLYVGNFIGKR